MDEEEDNAPTNEPNESLQEEKNSETDVVGDSDGPSATKKAKLSLNEAKNDKNNDSDINSQQTQQTSTTTEKEIKEKPVSESNETKSLSDQAEPKKPLSKKQQKKLRKLQQARLYRQRRKQEEKEARYAKAKAQGRDIEKEKREQEERTRSGEGRRRREEFMNEKLKLSEKSFGICIDCAYADQMTPKEINSLSQQIRHSYAVNKRSSHPVHLYITSLQGDTYDNLKKVAGFPENWVGRAFTCSEKDVREVVLGSNGDESKRQIDKQKVGDCVKGDDRNGKSSSGEAREDHASTDGSANNGKEDACNKNNNHDNEKSREQDDKSNIRNKHSATSNSCGDEDTNKPVNDVKPNENTSVKKLYNSEAHKTQHTKLVYLTSDSPHELSSLDDHTVYIIGGIVDRNRLKRAAITRAESILKIPTARLPIDEHVDVKATKVLTCNHVFEILVKLREFEGDWKKALLEVLPGRKDVNVKEKGGEKGT